MRALASLLLLVGACDAPPAPPGDKVRGAINRIEPANAVTAESNEIAPDLPDPAALADMSPRQRRAYELGFRDCSAGRYDPDPHPEAYRIGCGAAEERR